jgi:hypothetical protein
MQIVGFLKNVKSKKMRYMNDIKNPKAFVLGRAKCYLSNGPLMATYN